MNTINPDVFTFYKALEKNNTREWFEPQKTRFKALELEVKKFNELVKLDFDQLISTTCMVSPFSIQEKQKLIETVNMEDKVKTLEEIINFNLMDIQENKTIQ